MLDWFFKLFQSSYGNELERYVTSHNPMDVGDVERLTLQYQRKKDNLWS
jgi:hypothetical protein